MAEEAVALVQVVALVMHHQIRGQMVATAVLPVLPVPMELLLQHRLQDLGELAAAEEVEVV
jgi:hypothetical protein